MLPLPLVVVVELVIFGGKKKTLGAQKLGLCCYRKLLGAPSRSSHKINDGEYNRMLLVLSLNKRDR